MTKLIDAALEFQSFCERMNWRFCFIGGLALQVWGEQRLTRDIDLTLFTGFHDEELFVDALLKKYDGRRSDTREFAFKNRVLLLETKDKLGIDVALGGFPFEEDVVERATYQKYTPEISLKICSAEDLIIFKTVASRGRDLVDIETVLIKQNDLDWHYIDEIMSGFSELLYSSEAHDRLKDLKRKFYQK